MIAFKTSLNYFLKNSFTTTRILSSKMEKFSTAAKEQKIQVKGQTINYLKVGTGSHNIFCFPGAVGTIWTDFKPQIEDLDKTLFTIIAFDPPGYGKSIPPNRKYDVDFYEKDADMARELLKSIDCDKTSLLGWSDGGISSMILAAKYPDVVDKLIIWGSNSYIHPEELKLYEAIRDTSKWSKKMKAPLVELYGEDGLQTMWGGWIDAVTELFNKKDGNICKHLLPNIKAPTFILHGDKDPLVLSEHPDYLLKNIANSKIHRFPDGRHNIHIRYPEEFNSLVTKFLLDK